MSSKVHLAAVLSLLVPAPSFAKDNLRYTTVFEERIDGTKQPSSAAEAMVVNELMRAGFAFIDEAQSRKIRSVTDAGALMNGEVSSVITSLDADVILAGVVTVSSVSGGKNALLKDKMSRCDASIEARAIAVDSAQVLGVFQARGSALEFSQEQSAKAAARKAGEQLASQLREIDPAKSKTRHVDLAITGVPNVTREKTILEALRAMPGVVQVEPLESNRSVTKIGVELEQVTAHELALALDAAPSIGLVVFGYSENAIKAEFSGARTARFPLMIDPKSFDAVFASLLRTELSNLGFIEVATQEAVAKGADRALLVEGKMHQERGALVVEARVLAASSKKVILARSERCKEHEPSTCARLLGDFVRGSLFQELETKRGLFKGSVDLTREPAKPLQIVRIDASEIYPARLPHYSEHPLGETTLKNASGERLTEVRIAVEVVGFTRAPVEKSLPDVAPRATVRAPLNVVLEKEALVRHDENLPAVLRIVLSYRVGEYRFQESRTAPLVVYDRHALSWATRDSVAAFITHRSPKIVELAKSVRASIAEGIRGQPLAAPIALLRALDGLAYSPDPVNPFRASDLDYVQFPLETFARGGGDCDDLAVAFSSLAEAAGIETILVTTPDHVFVAVETGLPARNAELISLEPDAVLTHRGQAWIPVETTKVGRSFADAWNAAGARLAEERKRGRTIGIIDVRSAWSSFGPVDLSSASAEPKAADPSARMRAIEAEVIELGKRRQEALDRALSSLEQRITKGASNELLNRKGVLLAVARRFDEARAAFRAAAEKSKRPIRELNNLGNVALIEARPKDALEEYRRALAHAPKQPRIHLNAAIAAWALGDENQFGEHISRCVLFGGQADVEALRLKIATRAEDASNRSEWGVSGFVFWL